MCAESNCVPPLACLCLLDDSVPFNSIWGLFQWQFRCCSFGRLELSRNLACRESAASLQTILISGKGSGKYFLFSSIANFWSHGGLSTIGRTRTWNIIKLCVLSAPQQPREPVAAGCRPIVERCFGGLCSESRSLMETAQSIQCRCFSARSPNDIFGV